MSDAYKIEQLYLFVFTSLLAVALLLLAKKKRFFVLPAAQMQVPVFFKQLLGAFGSYLLLAFIILPLAYFGVSGWIAGSFKKTMELSFVSRGWLQQAALFVIFLWFILYTFLIKKESREFIYWGGRRGSLVEQKKSVAIGALGFVISYPLMAVVSIMVGYFSFLFFGKSGVEQVAVAQLKMTLGHPLLFASMVVSVVFFVPFVEELLFRGFLQSWLKRHLSRRYALMISAFIFSVVHFSPSQGIGNIELVASLFVLSCFLGFIYERQRSLVAPIVMHGIFNGFSALMIFLTN